MFLVAWLECVSIFTSDRNNIPHQKTCWTTESTCALIRLLEVMREAKVFFLSLVFPTSGKTIMFLCDVVTVHSWLGALSQSWGGKSRPRLVTPAMFPFPVNVQEGYSHKKSNRNMYHMGMNILRYLESSAVMQFHTSLKLLFIQAPPPVSNPLNHYRIGKRENYLKIGIMAAHHCQVHA